MSFVNAVLIELSQMKGPPAPGSGLFGIDNDPLPFPRLDVLQGPFKVSLWRLQRRRFLVGLEIGLNELD